MEAQRKTILIVGATSGIAAHCTRLWAEDPVHDFVLLGRDAAGLERNAADLRVRSPGATVRIRLLSAADFLDAGAITRAIADVATAAPIDIALVAHGSLPDQGECERDLGVAREALLVNAVSPALFAEAIAGAMAVAGGGTLAVLGSVAGDRGRKSNYVYGSAKGLLARYCEGLQHRFAGSGVHVACIKPGPTATAMTAHLAAKGTRLAPVEDVARATVAAIARRAPVAYVPGQWRWIMLVIRHLPRFVFNRMDI